MSVDLTAEELLPAFDLLIEQIVRGIFAATLSPKERAGLSLVITSKFMGTTCRIVQENSSELRAMELPELIRTVGNMVAGMVEREGHPRQ